MGDGATGGVMTEPCAERGPVEVGACHQFTWFPGSAGWAGVFWQYPDMNWGDMPGLAMPEGAQSVRFHAWGAEGGEVVEFGTGMGDVDGFNRSAALTLTPEPMEYVLDLADVTYTEVVGGFVWSAADSDTPVSFFVDGIHWSTEPAPQMDMDMPSEYTPHGRMPIIPGGRQQHQ